MSKQLLIETRMNSLSLVEGVQPKKGYLGTIAGPCADFVNPTRNDNFYSRKLWENVFKDPLVKESLEDRVLIGELDHPGDRLETKATNACIVMTGYKFNDKDGTVDGTFDILDTPNGRILKSLLDYGCKIGVSSRGEGDVTESNGVNNVDEESYYFVGFDAVVLPAVKKAKPALQESVKRESLKESLKKQISEAETTQELNMIKKVVEALNLPDIDSINESIENRSRELEGTDGSSNLMEDLEKANSQIENLRKDNKKLKREVTDGKSRVKRFIESSTKSFNREKRLVSQIERLDKENKKSQFELIASQNMTESLKSKVRSLERKCRSTQDRLSESMSQKDGLKRKAYDRDRQIDDLQNQVSQLEESLERSQNTCISQNQTIKDLRKQLDDVNDKLEESKSKASTAKLSESRMRQSLSETKKRDRDTVKSYAVEMSKKFGVDPNNVIKFLKEGMTIDDVNKLIDEEVCRNDRYRKLPTVNDSLIESLANKDFTVKFKGNQLRQNEEEQSTIEFVERFYNQNT